MKKRFFYYLLILAVLGGCASLQAKREVLENTFYSSYPEIQIKVGSEFEYIGETKEAEWRQYQDSTSTDTIRKDFYIFAQTDEERVKKSVVISVHKTKGYWVGDLWGRVENYYDRGTCKLGGVSWQYCSRYLDASKPGAVTKFAAEQGYVMPECLLIKHTSKAFGPKNNYLITISYIEEPPTSDYACHFWKPNSEKPNGGLEYSQLEYIEQFHKNAETSFKIVELGGQKLPKTDLQQELEKESLKIASVPEGKAKMPLRTEPKKLTERDIRKMLEKYDFYDDDLNWRGSFTNDFVDNGDGTITDRATGLMWQKSGSSKAKTWERAHKYVKGPNKDVFAGYSDWRLPTIEELASLVKREKVNGVHIDPVFDRKQERCWSKDSRPDSNYGQAGLVATWIGDFSNGRIIEAKWTYKSKTDVAITFYEILPENYVRLVRSSNEEKEKSRLEQRKRHEEKLQLASIPEGIVEVSLRTEPKKLLERDIRKMLSRYGFYDDDLNWRGSFANDFVDNGNGTITDKATGLMWQKSGSSKTKMWKRARTYVKQLNKGQFAGYSDWRLPTIEEFASLVEREKVNGVHIDPLFYDKQEMCWSSDKADPFGGHTRNPPQIWIVNFAKGTITTAILLSEVVQSTHSTSEYNYVRAVRGVK